MVCCSQIDQYAKMFLLLHILEAMFESFYELYKKCVLSEMCMYGVVTTIARLIFPLKFSSPLQPRVLKTGVQYKEKEVSSLLQVYLEHKQELHLNIQYMHCNIFRKWLHTVQAGLMRTEELQSLHR